MPDDYKFFITLWKIVGIVTAVLIISVSGCEINRDNKTAELVRSGIDPLLARCAIHGIKENADAVVCAAKAYGKGE